MIDIQDHIKDSKLKIIVKPNSPKNQIMSYDKVRQALRINIKAQPEKGKANKEVIKFFTKVLKKQVKIIKGFKNKEKILKIQ